MFASFFKPEKPLTHNIFYGIIAIFKGILEVANHFLKLKMLNKIIDFLDMLGGNQCDTKRDESKP